MSLYKPNVQKLLKKRDVPMLMKALGDADSDVRRDAVEALIIALNDLDPEVSAAAVTALAGIGKARAVVPLIAVLNTLQFSLEC